MAASPRGTPRKGTLGGDEGNKTFTATILGTSSESITGGKKEAVFRIQVIQEAVSWMVERTMRQFRDLNDKLKHKYSTSVVPSRFPSKSRLRSLVASPFLLDQQHMTLQTWLAKVLRVAQLTSSPEIHQFLEDGKKEVQVLAISVSTLYFPLSLLCVLLVTLLCKCSHPPCLLYFSLFFPFSHVLKVRRGKT
jgi:hypothetical protein